MNLEHAPFESKDITPEKLLQTAEEITRAKAGARTRLDFAFIGDAERMLAKAQLQADREKAQSERAKTSERLQAARQTVSRFGKDWNPQGSR
jgi:hypothetical protein